MPDTPRTRATLIGTNFVTGQSNGIGSDDLRDLVASVAPHYAAADPTVNDDINAASPGPFGIGCVWVNTSTGARFICKDNTDGAAVWKNVAGALFTEAESTSAPNGTVYVDSLTAAGASTNADAAIVPKGTGALLAAIPDNTATGGNKRGTNAVDLQVSRNVATQVASGNYAFVAGFRNTASGVTAVVSGGSTNSSTALSATVSGGSTNTSSGEYAVVSGGTTNTASGEGSAVGGGGVNVASGVMATVPGGTGNTASGTYSVASGNSALSDKYGQNSLASGNFVATGDAQTSSLVARRSTTNATPAELFLDGSSARCTIATDTTWAFTITVVARRTDADNESAAYKFEGCIDNNAGTVALVGTVTKTVLAEDTAAWDCDVTADDTNNALVTTFTGENGKTIRIVARIELTEVTG